MGGKKKKKRKTTTIVHMFCPQLCSDIQKYGVSMQNAKGWQVSRNKCTNSFQKEKQNNKHNNKNNKQTVAGNHLEFSLSLPSPK